MSERFLKISGNFEQYGKWNQPDPGFIGYIMVNDDGSFEGYLDEQYHTTQKTRFVSGVYNEKDDELSFCKLVATENLAPLIYFFPKVPIGKWFVFSPDGITVGGEAKIKLSVVTDAQEILERIKLVRKHVIEDGPDWNRIISLRSINGSLNLDDS